MGSASSHRYIFLVFGILLFAYVLLRAYLLPMTIDEGTNYLVYVQRSLKDVFLNIPVNTNNHFLNTFAIKLSTAIFGDGIIAVRLPGILGHLLFLVFSFGILERLTKHSAVLLFGLALFHFNPYFLEFFGLARGYALGWGFMAASMYYLLGFLQDGKEKNVWFCFISAGLSVYALLINLNYYVALAAVYLLNVILLYWEVRPSDALSFFWNKLKAPLTVGVILLAVLAYPVLQIREYDEFYGSALGFWDSSVVTVVKHSFYGQRYFAPDFPILIAGLMVLCVVAVLIKGIHEVVAKRDPMHPPIALSFASLLFLTGLSTVAQFYLLGTPYLLDRTALIYVPLFAPLPVILFSGLLRANHENPDPGNSKKRKREVMVKALSLLCFTVLFVHFLKVANFKESREWQYNSRTVETLNFIQADLPEGEKTDLAVGAWFGSSFLYYEKTGQHTEGIDVIRKEEIMPQEEHQYYYLFDRDTVKLNTRIYERVLDHGGYGLWRRK